MAPALSPPLTRALADPAAFAAIGGTPLRPYQTQVARAIARSVRGGEGKTFTVTFARQMGKNETSAWIEAYLLRLYAGIGGSIVKAAPAFKPQLITSMLRLQAALERGPLTRSVWRPRYGYILACGRANVTFLSADPTASVVGATASLLLEVDEAQDVDPDLYDRAFRPMASATNATTVLYGTAWREDSLLQRQIAHNAAIEQRTGDILNFRADWTVLAALNEAYRRFVEGEITRLGEEHPAIQTQYFLHCLRDAGRMFSAGQRERLAGSYPAEHEPEPGAIYVAGIDLAGGDERAADAELRALAPRKDSTVVTIARIAPDFTGAVTVQVVAHCWWTGRDPARQFDDLLALWRHWRFRRVAVDATGIGAATAAFLARRFGDRVEEVVFSAPTKSRLAFALLAAINQARVQVYRGEDAESGEFWREVKACRSWAHAEGTLAWGVPETEGHDDFIAALALCLQAAGHALIPPAAGLLRPRPERREEAW